MAAVMCFEKQAENAQSEMGTRAGAVAWDHWCVKKLWSQPLQATRLKLFQIGSSRSRFPL